MANIPLYYVAWRQGRPRFVPGARERAMGFKGQDLRHDDGRWYSLDEAHAWSVARRAEIVAQRATGKRLKSPPVPRARNVEALWDAYTRSDKFKGNDAKKVKGLAPSSQDAYRKFIRPIEAEPVWQAPVGALDPIVLKALHGKILGDRGLAMANASLRALSAALSWGRLNGWLPKVNGQVANNPASRLDLPSLEPRIRIGTDAEIAALVAASDRIAREGVALSAVGDAVLTAFFSGQRKKDVLAFVPGETTANRIELVQSKTRARVSIPMAPRLVERIAQARERRKRLDRVIVSPNVVVNEQSGKPYNGSTFRDHFNEVRAAAIAGVVDEVATAAARALHLAERRNGEPPTVWRVTPCKPLADFTFPDLRDTAVTWYARAGATVPEIAAITGHTLSSVYTILKHYLALDAHLADNAVRKLVDYMEREGLAV